MSPCLSLRTQFVFNQYFRAFVNYGYLDAEYDDFQFDVLPNDGIDNVVDASFLTPRNAPENTFAVGATVSIPMGNGAWEIFSKFTRIDEIEGDLLNVPQARLDEIDDLSATIGYYTDRWSISAFGRNLTDERQETFVPIATLFAAGTVNRPRSFGVQFDYHLGNN